MAERPETGPFARPLGSYALAASPRPRWEAAIARATRAARHPVVVSDPRLPDAPIVLANEAFARLTGYPVDEVLGRNCRFLQGPGTAPTTVATLRRALRDGGDAAVELVNCRRDGTPFWNALFVAPVFDDAGRLAYHFASQRDVTGPARPRRTDRGPAPGAGAGRWRRARRSGA